jgi:hypothetical protein
MNVTAFYFESVANKLLNETKQKSHPSPAHTGAEIISHGSLDETSLHTALGNAGVGHRLLTRLKINVIYVRVMQKQTSRSKMLMSGKKI